ncbi:MAG: ABC transporter substrate-binding protein [Chloroflexia bacterium]|nr:ABC transporter substrate-binding protein [Chloroflexia bacterium]
MRDPRFETLVDQVRTGAIDRRTFVVRAAALGVSGLVAGAALRSIGASAQDATPGASPVASPVGSPVASPVAGGLSPENLGVAGVAHNTDTSAGTINLYSSWPMTAASAQLGGDSAEAVRFAVELWGGAAGGFAINYEALDDGIAANNGSWDAATEASNATMVVNDQDAVAYIATFNSGAAEASIPITNEAGMAMISPSNTAVQLTKQSDANPPGYPDNLYAATGVRNYMRVVPADDLQGGASANFAFNTLGAQTAYVLHDNQTYGLGLANVFESTFTALGGSIVGFDAFQPDAPEYQALANGVANAGPALVYISAIVNLNASKLLQDLRELLPSEDVAIIGPDGLINQAFIDGAGDASEGMYLTFGGLPANELEGVGAEFYNGMLERLDHEPDAYAVYAFECAVVVLQAIDQVAAKDRAAILDTMFNTSEFRGLIGTWSFTETGDTTAETISLNVVQDGQITFQEVIGLA